MKKIKLSNYEFNKNVIYTLFLPLIVIGKLIRHTLMKAVLVDVGIGFSWISEILYGDLKFVFWQSESNTNTRGNAITFFQKINIFNITSYNDWEIYISIIFNIILLLVVSRVKYKLSFEQFMYICLSIMVLNIFDFCLAKEPVQMLYFLLIFIVLISKRIKNQTKYIVSCLVILLSAATLRNYYLLILLFMVVSTLVCNVFLKKNRKIKITDILIIILAVGVCYYIFLNIVKHVSPGDYSELIRVRSRTSDARTDIRNFIQSSNLVIFTINYIITIIRLVFPIELLLMGPKYAPYILYQIFMSYFLIKNIKSLKQNTGVKNIVIYLYIGFILGSAAFEPDFGSWVRHEAILFPLILFSCDAIRCDKKNDDKQEEKKNEV